MTTEMQISYGYSERTFSLKYKPGAGYQWIYNDGEPRSQVFQTQLEAEMWMRREHGEFTKATQQQQHGGSVPESAQSV